MINPKLHLLEDVLSKVFPNDPYERRAAMESALHAISKYRTLEELTEKEIEEATINYLDIEIHEWRMALRQIRINNNKSGGDRITANVNLIAAILTFMSTIALTMNTLLPYVT